MNGKPETVVATVPMAPVSVLVLGIFIALLAVTSFIPFLTLRLLLVGVSTLAAYRFLTQVAKMKLAVNDFKVVVVNLRSRHELELWSVRIEVRDDPKAWPRDDLLPEMREAFDQEDAKRARSLVLVDSSDQQVRVGIAPSYGRRLDTITENLNIAIAKHRSD